MENRIGPFKVLRELGRGGMGVVTLAIDTRLDREVAIKSLPEHLAADPARLERFEREARTLAGLNHPNIAGIHGIEEQDGARYLVLEYVDGETLADVLDRGPLPVDLAIEYAAQIAAGVEAAHDAGVIHRDLKPANVQITGDGIAKVLDFGLARVEEGRSATGALDSPTITSPAPRDSPTIEGAILGTAAYMSPEQARGRRIDRRTDVWSFGVVLYEMLVGASPFAGETASDSIGAVLHKELDLDRLPATTPRSVRRVLERCLVRDKAWRYRDIGDVRLDLVAAAESDDTVATTSGARGARPLALAAGAIAIALLAGAAGWFSAGSVPPPGARPGDAPAVEKFDLVVGTDELPLDQASPRISPDGTRVAFISDDRIHVRAIDAFESQPVVGTEGAVSVFWSPDGEWLGFIADRSIRKVPVRGGGVSVLCSVDAPLAGGGTWTSDDWIVVSAYSYDGNEMGGGLLRVAARGGEPELWLDADREEELHFHEVTAARDSGVVFLIQHLVGDGGFALQAFDGTRRVDVARAPEMMRSPAWSPTGHVLYSRGLDEQAIWAVPFSPERMETTGEHFLVLSGADDPSVSENGTLALRRGNVPRQGDLVLFDETGNSTRLLGGQAGTIMMPLVSPDGSRVAFTIDSSNLRADVWVHEIETGRTQRLTYLDTTVRGAAWSPDGTELAINHADLANLENSKTIFLAADGSGETRPPIDGMLVSFDARWERALAVEAQQRALQMRAFAVRVDDPDARVEVSLEEMRGWGVLSPNGRFVAFDSMVGGVQHVFVSTFPDGRGRWQVSAEGGTGPAWAPDGSFLLYTDEDNVRQRVRVEPGTVPRFGSPEPVISAEDVDWSEILALLPTSESGRFIGIRRRTDAIDTTTLSVVRDWFEQFRDTGAR